MAFGVTRRVHGDRVAGQIKPITVSEGAHRDSIAFADKPRLYSYFSASLDSWTVVS